MSLATLYSLAIEQEAEGLEALLHDPDFQAKRFAEIPEMVEKLDAAKAKVARLYTRWEELEAVRAYWERWQDHPNNDFAQFKMVCQLRPEVESPCVVVIERNGQPQALLAGRLEKTQFAPPIGYIKPVRIPAKVMAVLHEGILGQMDDEAVLESVEYLWSLLRSGVADAIEFHHLSEDSPFLNALQLHRSGWFCDPPPRWSVHWEMTLPAEGAFIEHKVRSKHRTGIWLPANAAKRPSQKRKPARRCI